MGRPSSQSTSLQAHVELHDLVTRTSYQVYSSTHQLIQLVLERVRDHTRYLCTKMVSASLPVRAL